MAKVNETKRSYTPTLGFSFKKLVLSNFEFRIWDVPGQKKFRPMWKKGYKNANLILYVVDISDESRLDESANALSKVLDDMKDKRLFVMVAYHKIDLIDNLQDKYVDIDKHFTMALYNRRSEIFWTSIEMTKTIEEIKQAFINKITKVLNEKEKE